MDFQHRYKIIGELGSGGMGKVYQAQDLKLKRIVAIKVTRSALKPNAIKRFQREAQAIASLNHPNIVSVYDIGEIKGEPYFTMEYVAGKSLGQYIKTIRSQNKIIEMMIKILEAVGFAHSHKIIHRDLKPSNIMVTDKEEPKIMDFGLVKIQGGDQNTRTGEILGTLQYMSPEQAEGRTREMDHRVDIYALGVILYLWICGRTPFKNSSSSALIKKILFEEPVSPRKIRKKISENMEKICLKAMAKKIEKRYSTTQEFIDDLRRLQKGESVLATSTSNFWGIFVQPLQNLKLVALLFLLLLGILFFFKNEIFFGEKIPENLLQIIKTEDLKPSGREEVESISKYFLLRAQLRSSIVQRVDIDGTKISLDKRNFSVKIPLAYGENNISIRFYASLQEYRDFSYIIFRKISDSNGFMFRGDFERSGCIKTDDTILASHKDWEIKLSGEIHSSPIIHNENIYVCSQGIEGLKEAVFYALNRLSGKKIWEKELSHWRSKVNPAISGNLIYFGDNKYLYAADLKTGEEVWRFLVLENLHTSPIVADGKVFIVETGDIVYALNMDTGEVVWKNEIQPGVRYIDSSPAIYKNTLYVATNGLHAFDIKNGELKWTKMFDNGWSFCTPAVSSGYICIGDDSGRYYVFNDKGDSIWTERIANANIRTSSAVSEGIAYFAAWNGVFYAYRIANGEYIKEYPTLQYVDHCSPVIRGERIYFATASGILFCLNKKTLERIWMYHCGNEMKYCYGIAVGGGMIYFGDDKGNFYAISEKKLESK